MSAFCITSNYLSSQAVSNQVLSTYVGLTTVFGMGTGGTPQLSSLDKLATTYPPRSFPTKYFRRIRA